MNGAAALSDFRPCRATKLTPLQTRTLHFAKFGSIEPLVRFTQTKVNSTRAVANTRHVTVRPLRYSSLPRSYSYRPVGPPILRSGRVLVSQTVASSEAQCSRLCLGPTGRVAAAAASPSPTCCAASRAQSTSRTSATDASECRAPRPQLLQPLHRRRPQSTSRRRRSSLRSP